LIKISPILGPTHLLLKQISFCNFIFVPEFAMPAARVYGQDELAPALGVGVSNVKSLNIMLII
jgi:hypothetical protein